MKIIIIDDDQLVSLSLKTILEASTDIKVAALGKDGSEALELYETHQPDVLLMDIQMKNVSGLEASQNILSKYPQAKILLLTTFSDDEYIVKAIQLGTKGYILKQAFETITPAINAVYNGQTVFGDEIMNKIPDLMQVKHSSSADSLGLTQKEYEIVKLVSEGMNNKEIAGKLFLGEGTVRNYISTILEKLDLRDRTQLAVFYYKSL